PPSRCCATAAVPTPPPHLFPPPPARRYGRSGVGFSPLALDRIRSHTWPGNVRELRNVIEQAVLTAGGDTIDERHLGIAPAELLGAASVPPLAPSEVSAFAAAGDVATAVGTTLMDIERMAIGRALAQTQGNVTRAAKLLGISRDTLRYRIEKYGIG